MERIIENLSFNSEEEGLKIESTRPQEVANAIEAEERRLRDLQEKDMLTAQRRLENLKKMERKEEARKQPKKKKWWDEAVLDSFSKGELRQLLEYYEVELKIMKLDLLDFIKERNKRFNTIPKTILIGIRLGLEHSLGIGNILIESETKKEDDFRRGVDIKEEEINKLKELIDDIKERLKRI